MDLAEKTVIVTGGGNGIGEALCRRFAAMGARVVVSDLDGSAARRVASDLGTAFFQCDAASEAHVQGLVRFAVKTFGSVDVFCSNAGITVKGGEEQSDEDWHRMWDVNVMSRVYAARAVVPVMLKQGGGYIVHTASGAGLLTEIGSASYSVTKHADVAFAEWLAVRYGREGIQVSCICPLGVDTGFLDHDDPVHQFLHAHAVTVNDVADAVIEAMEQKQFLILPHPEVQEIFQMKAEHYDKWISGFQRLRQKLERQQNSRHQRSRKAA